MQRHEQRVYNIALRMTGNPEDAADLTQECFLRLFSSLHTFRGESAFSTWLYRLVTNVCLDQLKRRSRRRETQPRPDSETGEDALERLPDPGTPVDETIARKQRQAAVQAAIASLPEHQRITLILYDLEGFSYQQIAELSGASLGTVKSRLNRARLALKNRLEALTELFPGIIGQMDG